MTRRLPLSVIIITRNEADRLPRTLASLTWADQIVVVDAASEDGTADLARAAGAEVHPHPWQGYSAQKEYALARVRHAWVLWIDADEVVTPELRDSIAEITAGGAASHNAYALNRRTSYLGRFVRFGGWYPDRKVRLFHRDHARFDGRMVHEELRIDGSVGRLAGDLLHYSYRDLNHHARKTQEMAALWAAESHDRRRVSTIELVARPLAKLLKSYLLRAGFLEGWRGLLIAGMGAYSVWLKYALLRERQERGAAERRKTSAGRTPAGETSERGRHAGSGEDA